MATIASFILIGAVGLIALYAPYCLAIEPQALVEIEQPQGSGSELPPLGDVGSPGETDGAGTR